MKRMYLIPVVILMLLMVNTSLWAQRGPGRQAAPRQECLNLPELSEEQKNKMNTLQTARLQESNQYRAQMDELRAKRRSLMIAEKPDMKQVNSLIDQMEKLRADHQKSQAKHHQSIRELLNPEQRAVFDNRTTQRGQYARHGQRAGMEGRGGRGQYRKF